MFDIISPLMPCAVLWTWAFAHNSMSGPRQGEVQILLTWGRLVRKFSNMQQCELLAEPLPSGAPVLSIPIGSGLQRPGASAPSDLYVWPDTSLSHGGWGLRSWTEVHYAPTFLTFEPEHVWNSPRSTSSLLTDEASAWSTFKKLGFLIYF